MKKSFWFLVLTSLFLIAPSLLAATPNTLVKGESSSAVYFVGQDQKRYVFPNEKIYKSWYKDFSNVQTISDSELASIPIGGNATYREGTNLVKIVSDPKVYAIEPGGILRPIPDEATAITLFGSNWANRVNDLADAFFTDYEIGDELSSNQHPEGTIFQFENNLSKYYRLVNGQARPVSFDIIDTNFSIIIPSSFEYIIGSSIAENEFPTIDRLNISEETQETTEDQISENAEINIVSSSNINVRTPVVGDDSAIITQLQITGDENHDVTIKSLNFTYGINTNHIRIYTDTDDDGKEFEVEDEDDYDWQIGHDLDANQTNWEVANIISGTQVIDQETGVQYGASNISLLGKSFVNVNIPIKAGEVKFLDIAVEVNIVTDWNSEVAIGINPATDIVITSSTAKEINITPNAWLNNPESPYEKLIPTDYGKMTIDSTNTSQNGFKRLGQEYSPMSLTFTAQNESFTVKQVRIDATTIADDVLAIDGLALQYTDSFNILREDDYLTLSGNQFIFSGLDIFVEKNTTVSVPLLLDITNADDVFSNSRLQFEFKQDSFLARSSISNLDYSTAHFSDESKLIDNTDEGPLHVFRNSSMSFSRHGNSPSGSVNRGDSERVFTFTVIAQDGPVNIKQLTFRMDTNDVNVNETAGQEGLPNDLLEYWADDSPNLIASLYSYQADTDDRNQKVSATVDFGIYESHTRSVNYSPENIKTNVESYGAFKFTFPGSGLYIPAGASRTYDLDVDTTASTIGRSPTLSVKLLGDGQSSNTSQSNILWNDGSNILATGYLLGGLDVNGHSLTIKSN